MNDEGIHTKLRFIERHFDGWPCTVIGKGKTIAEALMAADDYVASHHRK